MDLSLPFFKKQRQKHNSRKLLLIGSGLLISFINNAVCAAQEVGFIPPKPSDKTIESILAETSSAPTPTTKPSRNKNTSQAQPDTITAPTPVPAPKLIQVPENTALPVPSLPNGTPPVQDTPYEAPTVVRNNPAIAPDNQPQENRNFPHFGDRKPHIWTNSRKPWDYAIHGTDVSWHNRSLNWSQMARSGISFVFIKATEGRDFLDPTFAQNWKAAKMAGIDRGAYHFYYFCRTAKEQLNWFIRNVPKDKSALPPVLDMEWNRASKTCRYHPTPAVVQREMRIFLRGIENHYGKRPIIYTSVDFFDDNNLGKAFKTYPFWLRSVAAHPDDRYDNHPWLFWQYTSTGRVPGMAGDADINIFIGNPRQWEDWKSHVKR